jgi:anti-sigma-K factor RskA
MSTPFEHDAASAGGPPDDIVLAGEYVLGVLRADERREVQARIVVDAGFAALVDEWEERLSPWLAQVDAVAPAAHVWPRIRTRLNWPSMQGARPSLWNNVGFWRTATGLASAAGLVAFAIGLRPQAPVALPPPVATQPPGGEEQAAKPVVVLARGDGTTGWLASIDVVHQKIMMVPVPSPAGAPGRANELWLIAPGEAPQSLGFVSSEKAHTIEVPAALRRALAKGSTLAITLEPQQGMPHAAPSGAIVAKGDIASI